MDRLFDDFWTPSTSKAAQAETQFTPACEVEESEGHYFLNFEMPGVSKDDVQVEFLGNQLIVSGERKNSRKTKEQGSWYSERQYGKFQRTFTLPTGVDPEKIEANYTDGVLSLMIPKAESAKPRQIKIGSNSNVGFFGKFLGQAKSEKEDTHLLKERVS
jgi:HSP20 family protein